MSRRYQLTETAAADVDGIVTYIADEGSVDAALRVHSALVEAFELLAERPGIGHSREDLTDRPYKFWSVFSYLIVYEPRSSPLQIVTVIHAARNVPDILNDLQ